MLLTGIIPGPSEPKCFDPNVDVVVEEINGLRMYDGYRDEQFQLKAIVILQVFDYPGQNKVLKCVGESCFYHIANLK